jgi:hypothetical protein
MAPFNNPMKGMTSIHIYLVICEKFVCHFQMVPLVAQ